MAIAAEVIAGIFVVVLLAATALAMLVGILGGVFGEGFERCERCRHITLSFEGRPHPGGCPATLHQHVAHVVGVTFHGVHLRHHG